MVDATNGTDDEIAIFTDANSVEGNTKLIFGNNGLVVNSEISASGNIYTNKNLFITGSPATDHDSSGIVTKLETGGTYAQFDLIYAALMGGPTSRAKANASATMPCIGMLLEAGVAGEFKEVLLQGFVRDDS